MTGTTPPTPHALAEELRPALTKLYVMYFRVSKQSDLTGPQLSIMSRLEENGPMRISQIAREEGIRMPTASNALHQLEQRDLVERIRDEIDRRGVSVRLTPRGQEELDRVGEERATNLTEMFKTLGDEERISLWRAADAFNHMAAEYGVDNNSQTQG